MKTIYIIILASIFVFAKAQTESPELSNRLIGINSSYTENNNLKLNSSIAVMPPPANDNCASATVLTVGAALLCAQTDNSATLQAGECIVDYAGNTEVSVWYRFTATSTEMVLDFMRTNSPTNPPSITVYGPFSAGGGCIPACTNTVFTTLQAGDPGSHILLSGLSTTGNNNYLIQIQGNRKNPDPDVEFCIGIANKATNSTSSVPSIINSCGTTFNGSTLGGYYNSGTGLRFSNLDGVATTCGSCGTAGDDVTFVVNNLSWFSFCTTNTGTFNVNFDVTSCVFSGLNSGAQMAILTGSSSSLTNIDQAPNPTYPASALWTSSNFSLAAGGCAFLVVDGFAGDACSYNYVLNNIAGGCVLLPIDLLFFNGRNKGKSNELNWATITEHNSNYFEIEKSPNGIEFEILQQVSAAGNSQVRIDYQIYDETPFDNTYYRLKETDINGDVSYSNIILIEKNFDKISQLVVDYTNPEFINLLFYASKQTLGNVELFASNGSLIYTTELNVNNGKNKISINKDNLTKGIYLAKLNVNGKILIQKIIIM